MKKFQEPEYYVISLCMVVLIIVSTLQIASRFILNFSLSWTEEVSRYVFILLVYVGMSLGFKRRKHVRVEIIDLICPPHILKHINTFNDIIICTLLIMVGWASIEIVVIAKDVNQLSPALLLPMYIVYSIIPLMYLATLIRIIQGIFLRYTSGDHISE